MNALDMDMFHSIVKSINDLKENKTVRVVILRYILLP